MTAEVTAFEMRKSGDTYTVLEGGAAYVLRSDDEDDEHFDGVDELRTRLVEIGLLDVDSGGTAQDFSTGSWSVERLIAFLDPVYGHASIELSIDGIEMSSGPCGLVITDPDMLDPWILSASCWELEGGSGSPGGGDDGREVLVKLGGRYLVYAISDGEQDISVWDATDDEEAVATFKAGYPSS